MATPQVCTPLDVHGTNHCVYGFALREDMRQALRKNFRKLPALSSNNWKGYHAELQVRTNRLFLARLYIDRDSGWRGLLARGPSIKALFGTSVPRKGLPADWFTGELEEEVQDVLTSTGVAEQSRFFVFEKGILKRVEVRESSIARKIKAWEIRSSSGSLDATVQAPEELRDGLGEVPTNAGVAVAGTFPAPVRRTGQTTPCAKGDDGDLKPGVPWPSPRFTVGAGDSSNCVTDNLTGLMWVRNPDATERDWPTALTYCNGLDGRAGRGGFTDWRLPTVQELQSLVDYGRYSPALPRGHPFICVQVPYYWSSTGYAVRTETAWRVYLLNGHVFPGTKTSPYYVWPVRCGGIGKFPGQQKQTGPGWGNRKSCDGHNDSHIEGSER